MGRYESILSDLFATGAFPDDAFHIQKALGNRQIIVYGAGEAFHYFHEVVMRRYGYAPCAILDRKFQKPAVFEGVPAYPPEAFEASEEDKRDGIVVMCLGNQRHLRVVGDWLRAQGFRRVMALRDIYEIHNPFGLPKELEEDGFRYYLIQRDRIESCLSLFEDDVSKEVYVRCLETHLLRKPVPIPMRPREEQYTPPDVPLARGYSRFLYCGVSVGEMERVLRHVGKVEELMCFDPDPKQYRHAVEFLAGRHKEVARRVSVIPCAVYSHEALVPFTCSPTSFGSRVVSGGESWAQCVSIDRVVPDFRPTFVCMDIEGAERKALKGMVRTLREHRPDLAVCVYHSPEHLWEIPLFLSSLDLGYRFYLRNYTSFVLETVLYAVSGN